MVTGGHMMHKATMQGKARTLPPEKKGGDASAHRADSGGKYLARMYDITSFMILYRTFVEGLSYPIMTRDNVNIKRCAAFGISLRFSPPWV